VSEFGVATLAGSGVGGSADGIGVFAQFNNPMGIAVDRDGNAYIADSGNYTIRKVSPAGVVSTLAGLEGVAGSADGDGEEARFELPVGIAVAALPWIARASFTLSISSTRQYEG
jgi:DNA-binding beta-propeller fold protein YncE